MNEKEFNDFIEKMVKEIDTAISGEANYLAAIGLSAYTEYIGGIYRKKIQGGESKNNYNEGLKLMDGDYSKLVSNYNTKENSMYSRIRCGLVHEYFIKKSAIIYRERKPSSGCGIEVNNGVITLYLQQYFDDFKIALKKLKNEFKNNNEIFEYVSNTLPNTETFHMSGYAAGNIDDFKIIYP